MDVQQLKSFQPAQALAALSPAAFDEAWCREWILRRIHRGGEAKCPHCDTAVSGAQVNTFLAGRRLVCKACRTWFDARTGSILAGTPLKYTQIFCLALFLGMELPVKEIAARVGVNQSTIYDWKDRLSFRV